MNRHFNAVVTKSRLDALSVELAHVETVLLSDEECTSQPATHSRTILRQITAAVILCFAVVVRLVQYASDRSLWRDEAMLSINFLHHTALQLLKPLEYEQGAPVFFLWLERLAVRVLGPGEYSLRLVPFLAALSSIFLFYYLAKKWVGSTAALVALFFFATSYPLIYWSSQTKQYSSDVLVALLLYLVASALESRTDILGALLLGLAGVIGVCSSHPAIFVFGGICLALFVSRVAAGNRSGVWSVVFASLLAITGFAFLYWISLRHLTADRDLRIYFWGSFAPSPFSLSAINWYYQAFFALFHDVLGLSATGLAAFAFLFGVVSLSRRSQKHAAFLVLPLMFALAASGVHRYPFTDRFLLFAAPALFLVLSEGLVQLARTLRSNFSGAGALVLALLCWQPLNASVGLLIHPYTVEELRPVLAYVQAHEKPGDVVYVYYGAKPAFDYYTDTSRFHPTGPVLGGREGRSDWRIYESDLMRLRGDRRVWMIFSHTWTGVERVWYSNADGVNEEKLLSYDLDALGHRLDTIKAPGAAAYLYDMHDVPAPMR